MHLNNLTPADLNSLVTAREAAQLIMPDDPTKAVNRIYKWKQNGLIQPTGLDPRNRPLYRIIDILRTEKRMRDKR